MEGHKGHAEEFYLKNKKGKLIHKNIQKNIKKWLSNPIEIL